MTQNKDEIKVNSSQKSSGIAVSRTFQKREVLSESKLEEKILVAEEPSASRREFFQSVIPASGKLLTGFLRTVSSSFSESKTFKIKK